MFKYYIKVIIRNLLKILWIFPIDEKKIYFQSFGGKSMNCNPWYIFKYMYEKYPDYKYVWLLDKEPPYTRVIEHKHFESFGADVYTNPQTVVSDEYSTEYRDGMEPYYPVNDDRNNALADKYHALAANEKDVIFGGRLGQYKYYDMAPVIEQVLAMNV